MPNVPRFLIERLIERATICQCWMTLKRGFLLRGWLVIILLLDIARVVCRNGLLGNADMLDS